MQFDIGRLFQVIEERLGPRVGPPVANGLLLVVVFAVAVLCLNWIITLGILPAMAMVAEFVRGNNVTVSWAGLVAFLVSSVLPGLSVWLVYRFTAHRLIGRFIRVWNEFLEQEGNTAAEMGAAVERFNQATDRVNEEVKNGFSMADTAVELANNAVVLANQRIDQLDQRIERLEASTPQADKDS